MSRDEAARLIESHGHKVSGRCRRRPITSSPAPRRQQAGAGARAGVAVLDEDGLAKCSENGNRCRRKSPRRFSPWRPRQPLPAGDQGEPEGNAAVVDKPLIQYAVEEAAAAGITDLIFVTGRNKRAIEDHFDMNPELERSLDAKPDLLRSRAACCRRLPLHLHPPGRAARPGARGAVRAAGGGQTTFRVLLADDLIDAQPPTLARMTAASKRRAASLLGVENVPREQTGSYGIVSPAIAKADVTPIRAIVEKPAQGCAVDAGGRRPLRADARDLRAAGVGQAGRGGEIQLTDAIAGAARARARAGHGIGGKRYDCGSKLGYLKATVETGLAPPGHRQGFRRIPRKRAALTCPIRRHPGHFSRTPTWLRAPRSRGGHRARMAARSRRSSRTAIRWCWSVMGGAVVFAGQLLPQLRMPLDLDYIHATRYGAATRAAHRLARAPPQGVRGRRGAGAGRHPRRRQTMAAIRDRLLELGAKAFTARCWWKRPAEEETHRRRFRRPAIPDRFVFGCGMDAKGYGATCPRSGPCGRLMLAISAAAACRNSRR
jgi:UTP--glucose-1-phosphate uridylyltransferase